MQLHRLHVKVGPRVGGVAGGGVGAGEERVLLPRPHLLSSALRAGNRTIAQDAELPLHLQHSSQLGRYMAAPRHTNTNIKAERLLV